MSKVASLFLYLGVYAISAMFVHFAAHQKRKATRVLFAAIGILLPCILAGLRYEVGTDYGTYIALFNRHSHMSLSAYLNYDQRGDIAFYVVSRIAGHFESTQLMFFIFAVITYLPVVLYILRRNDKEMSFFYAYFFLLGSFSSGLNIMRQMAAVSIVFSSLKYIYERKLGKFALTICCATLFHASAIVAFPLYFIWARRDKFSIHNFKAWLVVVAYIVVAANMPTVLSLLGERFESYGTVAVQGRNLSILLNFIWLSVFLLFSKAITRSDHREGLLIFMFIIGTVLGLTGTVNVYVKRIATYFLFADFVLIVQLRRVFDRRSQGIYQIMMLAYSVGMFILQYYIMGQCELFPYNWSI